MYKPDHRQDHDTEVYQAMMLNVNLEHGAQEAREGSCS